VAGRSPVGQQCAVDRVDKAGRNPVDADGTEQCAAPVAAAAASSRLHAVHNVISLTLTAVDRRRPITTQPRDATLQHHYL